MKKKYWFFVTILVFSFFSSIQSVNAQACVAGCTSNGSCGGNISNSCGSPYNCRQVSVGNGQCQDWCTCDVVSQGSTFSSCSGFADTQSCNFSGGFCQVGSTRPMSFPNGLSYACSGNVGSGGSNPPPIDTTSNYFSLSVVPTTRSILNGNTTTYVLTITPDTNPNSGLADVRAVGDYTLPNPIPGCPAGATCTYSGGSTMTVTQDTTSGGVDYAVATSKTVIVTATSTTPNTYPLLFSATNEAGKKESVSTDLIINASAPVITISASPSSATAPGATTLTWSVANNPTSCTASGGYASTWTGSKAANGSAALSGYPTGTYNLTLSCTNSSGTSSNSATFTVSATPAPVVDMKGWGNTVPQASPIDGSTVMNLGDVGGLVWASSNTTNCQIYRDGTLLGNFPTNGSAGVGPMAVTSNHTITCTGPGGTSNTDGFIHTVPAVPVVNFTASPTSAASPMSTTLSWSATNSPTSCTAGGAWSGSKNVSGGSQVMTGIVTGTTYTLYCTNGGGNSTTASVTVTPVGAISVNISASPASMTLPTNSTTLTWTTTGSPTSCTASNYWSGSKTASGGSEVRTGMTAQNYTFTITCSKAGVPDATATVVVPVAAAPTPISISNFSSYFASITDYPTTSNNTIYWTTTGNPTSCVASGSSPWGNGAGTTAVNASLATGSHYQGSYPSVGTYTYTLTCSKAGVANATATFSVPVSAVASSNLTAGAAAPSSASASTPLTFSATITNSGSASTGAPFSNFFQVATAAAGGGTITDLTSTSMTTLAAAGTNTATSPSYTFPSAGTYSVRACADKSNSGSAGTIAESNEGDNCGSWTTVTVATAPTPISISNFSPYFTSITDYPTTSNNTIYWTTTGNPTSCVASGASPWNTQSVSPIASGSQYQGAYPSAGNYTYTLTCSKAGVPDATATFTVPVSVSGATACPSGNPYVASKSLGSIRNDYSGWVGTRITIGSSARTVTALGRIRVATNTGTHTVKLVNSATGADIPGGSVSINMSSGTAGQYVYATLASPVTLAANTSYNVVSQETNGGDQWHNDTDTVVTPSAVGTIAGAVYGSTGAWNFNGVPNRSYIPVDLCTTIQASFNLNPTTMSFNGVVGGATPPQQILQIVSSGSSDVWYTATSNQSWCLINGTTSLPGAVASSPVGQSTPVAITVAAPGAVGAGTNVCSIVVTDPSASPTSRTLTVTYTVAPAAVTQYTLTVNKTIGGSVTTTDALVSCGSTCTRAYNQGTVVTLQAAPDTAQWRFAGWSGACSGTGSCTLTIDGNKNVTAQFRPRALLYQEF